MQQIFLGIRRFFVGQWPVLRPIVRVLFQLLFCFGIPVLYLCHAELPLLVVFLYVVAAPFAFRFMGHGAARLSARDFCIYGAALAAGAFLLWRFSASFDMGDYRLLAIYLFILAGCWFVHGRFQCHLWFHGAYAGVMAGLYAVLLHCWQLDGGPEFYEKYAELFRDSFLFYVVLGAVSFFLFQACRILNRALNRKLMSRTSDIQQSDEKTRV